MSWQSLIKPPGKDPKNINEWLALITEKIRELKQTENWYDVSKVITTSLIIDNLESHRSDAILSANQGRTLKDLIDKIETKIAELSKNSHIDIAKLKEALDENIPKIASNIESLTELTNMLNTLSASVEGNRGNIESINTRLTEIISKISTLESNLNVISDRINTNNDTITKRVDGLETKVDQNLVKVNNEIAGITSDIGQIVGGNEILTGLNVTISSENVITTTEGKVIIKGDVISIDTRLSINVTAELLNRDCILMLTLKLNSQKQPILSLVENISADEVLISKLSIIDGKIVNNSKMEVLQPINTMIGLAAENEADTIRETIPSGFTRLGELDYEYMLNHENEVKIKSESVAYVNGYKVVIPKDTIINIGKAPEKESREDLLFLEAWKDEDFPKSGKVKWRIRHVVNVDFNKRFIGDTYIGWNDVTDISNITSQGGNSEPFITDVSDSIKLFYPSYSREYQNLCNLNDRGLWVAGNLLNELTKTSLKTYDGLSYAIPMFRLYRKPSCGKSIPFEYSKINPKVDYSKFAKLMKEEKIERVVSENIHGRSLINLATPSRVTFAGTGFGTIITNIMNGYKFQKTTTDTFYPKFVLNNSIIKPLKTYTIYYHIKLSFIGKLGFCLAYGDSYLDKNPGDGSVLYNAIITTDTECIVSHTFTTSNVTKTSDEIAIGFTALKGATDWCEITNLMILEGDWTNREIPEFFIGLKSLGEDDGNLITIKNGIIDDDTYDVNDGNQKLNTFSQVTHVLSENNIIPKVEADIKRGEQKLSILTEFKKLDTNGDEKVEFTKIKGRTIQNIITNTKWNINSNKNTAYMEVDWSLLKPNTNYTYYIYGLSSKVNKNTVYPGTNFTHPQNSTLDHPILINSVNDFNNAGYKQPHVYGSNFEDIDFIHTKIIIVEGDYTNIPLEEFPCVEGIKSVGETENNKVILESRGKNLHGSIELVDSYRGYQNGFVGYNRDVDGYIIPTKPNTKYFVTFHSVDLNHISNFCFLDINKNFISGIPLFNRLQFEINTPSNCFYLTYATHKNTKMLQIEQGENSTAYEPPKIYKQEVQLKEPLRSLPNDVYDEIVGNKIIRRVGKVILDGSENYHIWGGNYVSGDKTFNVFSATEYDSVHSVHYHLLCNTLPCNHDTFINKSGNSVIIANKRIHLSIKIDQLSEASVVGVKKWLSQHPTTVYYELATPVEEYLEIVYDKESIKTYQLDAPLRSLPNGVRDEIKDGVLIRRCGEITYNENHYFAVIINNRPRTIVFNIDKLNDMNPSHVLSIDKFPSKYVWEVDEEGMWIDNNGKVYISILKSKLTTSQDSQGLKSYLKSNNIKVIYPLIVNNETILTEVNPYSSNFSLQRQFAEGNWLRELPNGVKDTIENGKVVRRVGKKILNGSEIGWSEGSNNNDKSKWFYLPEPSAVGDYHDKIMILCDNISYLSRTTLLNKFNAGEEFTAITINGEKYFELVISRNKLSQQTLESFKTWLSQNPITILYELTEQKVEDLNNNNYMYFPYHSFNTCCGNMYVGDGRNYVLNENKLPSENNLIINTEFREINSNEIVEACKYKKSDEGYNSYYEVSRTKNLFNPLQSIDQYGTLTYDKTNNTYTHKSTSLHTACRMEFLINSKYIFKPNTDYILQAYVSSTGYSGKIRCDTSATNFSTKENVSITSGSNNVLVRLPLFTTSRYDHSLEDNIKIRVYLPSKPINAIVSLKDIMLIEDDKKSVTEYEDYKPMIKYIENTEENDIDDLRHEVSLTGFEYSRILEKSFDSLLRGEL